MYWECFLCENGIPKDEGDFILIYNHLGDDGDEVWACNECIDKNESED